MGNGAVTVLAALAAGVLGHNGEFTPFWRRCLAVGFVGLALGLLALILTQGN